VERSVPFADSRRILFFILSPFADRFVKLELRKLDLYLGTDFQSVLSILVLQYSIFYYSLSLSLSASRKLKLFLASTLSLSLLFSRRAYICVDNFFHPRHKVAYFLGEKSGKSAAIRFDLIFRSIFPFNFYFMSSSPLPTFNFLRGTQILFFPNIPFVSLLHDVR